MHRFYAPDIEHCAELPEEEARHCVKVLRLSAGSEVEVVDGRGTVHRCVLTSSSAHGCSLRVLSSESVAPHWQRRITLGVAPTKNLDRMEWLVEKCVELGVDRIVPLLCANSERKVLKTARLHKIAVAAMKQSLKAHLPEIEELTPLDDFLALYSASGARFIAYCDSSLPREKRFSLARELDATGDVAVLIGPEGDFTAHEVQQAAHAGFMPVTLGESRLRTETAAVVAVAMAHTATQLAQHPHENN